MADFTFHTEDTAPTGSKPLVQGAKRIFGFLPNLIAGMAEAPALTEGYLTLARIFDKTNLSDTEKQIILMTNNRLNGCTYCMAANTSIARGANVPDHVITSLREGTAIDDRKLEGLRQFTIAMNEKRGWVEEKDLEAFFAVGYNKQTVLEVVLGTSLKVMSNYTNHITKTPVDDAFKPNIWEAQ